MKFEPDDVREIERISESIGALLDEIGGVHEIRELEIKHFSHQLDEDDEGAERVLRRIAELGLLHETSSQLCGVLGAALRLQNPALARAAFAGIQALVRADLAAPGDEEGEEG